MLGNSKKKVSLLVVITLVFAGVLALSTGTAFAQAVSSDLIGTVTDTNGAVIANATVTVENPETGFKSTATTNSNCEYTFKNLPIGTYTVTVTAKGYSNGTIKALTLVLNKVGIGNVKLGVAGKETTIDVIESSTAVDTASANVENNYDKRVAETLPTASIGAGVLNASMLDAGVASSGGVGAGSGP